MKPISVCLTHMGKSGLELVDSYPDNLPKTTMNEIVMKSMPLSAKEGDFSSSTAQDCLFESYIFSLPGEQRQNIASLVVVFADSNYDRQSIRKFLSFTVAELKKNQLDTSGTLIKLLPNLYKGIEKGKLKIKISSVVTLEFDFGDDDTKKKKQREEEFVESIKGEFWR